MKRIAITTTLALALIMLGIGLALGKFWFDRTAGLASAVSADAVLTAKKADASKLGDSLRASQAGRVLSVRDGDSIQAAVLQAQPGDTVQVFAGAYKETVYIDKDAIALIGVIENGNWPVLEGEGRLNDAILYSGNGTRVENFKITHYKGNGIMGQAGNNFVLRHNWIVDTGVYGIFPQFGQNGLIEYNVLTGIEDAAIYVGMCDNVHVAHNEVFANVAGIEIENSRHVIVENNVAYDNTGGILAFITPGLPIKTTADVIFRNNFVYANNRENFAAQGSIVSGLPAGTGIVVMAADEVVIENNLIRDHKNVGIAIVDHQSFANVTIDPESEPNPDRIQILPNLMLNNGYEPATDLQVLMTATLHRGGIDIVAVGGGTGSCIVAREQYQTIGVGGYQDCTRTSTRDIASYLLDAPAPPRNLNTPNKAELVYNAICAGCHAYNARMIGPPTITIQAIYENDAQGVADYIANPVRKREDFPAMPPQSHLPADVRLLVAEYMLKVAK